MSLNCPTCNISLNRISICGETVDQCDACNGTWYEQTELSSILSALPNEHSPDQATSDPPETINCPQCDTKVASSIYAHDSKIRILKCSDCKGVWLVSGQLEQIAQFRNGPHKSDGLAKAMAASFKSSSRLTGLLESRRLSLAFAAIILFVARFEKGNVSGIGILSYLLLPLACIWFPRELGNLTGIRMGLMRPTITHTTPPIAVAIGGWLVMLAIFGLTIYRIVAQ